MGCTAIAEGVASLTATKEELRAKATAIITRTQEETRVLMERGLIGAFDLSDAWLWDWEQDFTGSDTPDAAVLRAPHVVRKA